MSIGALFSRPTLMVPIRPPPIRWNDGERPPAGAARSRHPLSSGDGPHTSVICPWRPVPVGRRAWSALQVPEHGQHAPVLLGVGLVQAELGEDAGDVALH